LVVQQPVSAYSADVGKGSRQRKDVGVN
jgi:hypothetical protein